jgi:signal peptidase I
MQPRSVYREYFEALVIAGIFLAFANTYLIKTFYIPSGSMEETLLVGDHLFVNRFIYGPATGIEEKILPRRDVRRGDIVIFRSPDSPSTDLVKRCMGLPGDEIRIDGKKVSINGVTVDDSLYAIHRDPRIFPDQSGVDPEHRLRDTKSTFRVPEGEYFFLGDNRDNSRDSRYWGTVPAALIKGRAMWIYWSYAGETPDGEWHGWWQKLRQTGRTFAGFVTESRWSRTFHLPR